MYIYIYIYIYVTLRGRPYVRVQACVGGTACTCIGRNYRLILPCDIYANEMISFSITRCSSDNLF